MSRHTIARDGTLRLATEGWLAVFFPFDDFPEWVRQLRDQQNQRVIDTQQRCDICCGILPPPVEGEIRTDEHAHEHCFRLDVLRQQVANGAVTDWPASLDFCGRGAQHHIASMKYTTSLVHWLASVKAALSMYNSRNDTRYRFY